MSALTATHELAFRSQGVAPDGHLICLFMDDHGCTGPGDSHLPHNANPDLSKTVTWEDGDERVQGHLCVECGHVVAEYPYHSDPRLDADRT